VETRTNASTNPVSLSLIAFWQRWIDPDYCERHPYSPWDYREKLAHLKAMDALRFEKVSYPALKRARDAFTTDQSFRYLLKRKCWACSKQPAELRHHIIELQHGGRNERENLVALCNFCHSRVHNWLIPIVHKNASPEVKKMERERARRRGRAIAYRKSMYKR
jgi:5-methylcytosine-specific restriction endonuclease McrA